jgi:chromate transporter
VSNRGWMTDDQFFSGYSLSQVISGVNSSNLTVYIGQHLRGAAGAVVALLALLTGPFVVVILAAVTYQYLLQVPGFQAAMAGIAAAAIGMLVRLALIAAHKATTAIVPTLILLIVFISVGFLRWPLVYVVLVMAPISIALTWKESKAKSKTDA